jgi:uncharacterized protein YjiK
MRRWVLIGAAAVALGAAWFFKVPAVGWYLWQMQAGAAQMRVMGVWLPNYGVTIEAKPVAGLSRNASGLTYSVASETLFTVINQPPQLAELSTDGRLLRLLPIRGGSDPEGISHVADDLFVISDEGSQTLHWVRIGPDDTEVDLTGTPRLKLRVDAFDNMGFEGISWDNDRKRLFVVQEMLPLRVLVFDGLEGLLAGGPLNMAVGEWKVPDAATLFVRDLSSITLHEPTGHVLILSHMSAMVVEYDPDGIPVSALPLWGGFAGLSDGVPQAEGLAFGPDGAMYVISEPNLFYRFDPDPVPVWAKGPGQAGVGR